MFRRIAFFLLTNLAIVALISILLSIFHVQPYLNAQGLDYQSLMAYSLIVGFAGSFISLFLSKWMAKSMFGVQIIHAHSPGYGQLADMVERRAQAPGIKTPEMGIFQSPEPNAFATGWSRNNALLAVSSGLLQVMNPEEIEGVIGHELSHIANGDMVTLTLIQGVLNTFVIFFARIAAFVVTNFFRSSDDNESAPSTFAFTMTAFVFEILFGILAMMIVMWFSRWREYRADAGSARLVGKDKMIAALRRLQNYQEVRDPHLEQSSIAAFRISGKHSWMGFLMSHPPLEARIEALERGQ